MRFALHVVDYDAHARTARAGKRPPGPAAVGAGLGWLRQWSVSDATADHADIALRAAVERLRLRSAVAFAGCFFPATALGGRFVLPSGRPTRRDICCRFSASLCQSVRWQDGQRAGTLSLLRETHL